MLQKIARLYPGTEFTIVFGVNSIVCCSARLLQRSWLVVWRSAALWALGVVSLLVVSSLLVVGFLVGISLVPTLDLLFLLTSSCGLIFGNASALALNEARHMAGSASAVMGTVQAMLGAGGAAGVVAGEHEYLPMGFSIFGFAVLTALVLWTTPRVRIPDTSADGKATVLVSHVPRRSLAAHKYISVRMCPGGAVLSVSDIQGESKRGED